MTRRFVGLMTGTSADGIDAALVRTAGIGEALRVEAVLHRHEPFPGDLAERLLDAMHPAPVAAGELARLGVEWAEAGSGVVRRLLEEGGVAPGEVVAVGAHGQTIAHLPRATLEDVGRAKIAGATLQIGDGATLADRTGIDVIADFRSADVAAGGQGAPLVAWPDLHLFGRDTEETIVLNLGGIANLTFLTAGAGPDDVIAYDIGPGCMVIDEMCRRISSGRRVLDRNGELSDGGRPDGDIVARTLAEHPFFARVPPRSTGREDFGREFTAELDRRLGECGARPADRVATAVALTIAAIEDACRYLPSARARRRWVPCGGGALHPALVAGIRRIADARGETVVHADELGIPALAREAVAFALLAAARTDGVAAALPGATGAKRRSVCGARWPAPERKGVKTTAGWHQTSEPTEATEATEATEPTEPTAHGDRGALVTERSNPRTADLDRLAIGEAFDRIQEEEAALPDVLARAKERLCRLAERFAGALAGGGRVVYVGAGTSGRLGVIDAAECPPTFRTPPDRIVGVIAGGPGALVRSVEGAEDDREDGGRRVRDLGVGSDDVVIGIAAGGTTPFVHGALEAAWDAGAHPALLTCVPESSLPPGHAAATVVSLVCGPEVVAGSTRMKAGTVTKMALHRLSTLAMVRLGKVFGPWMVDLDARACAKLRDRAIRVVAEASKRPRETARAALEEAGDVKSAIAVLRSGASLESARSALEAASGNLREALRRLGDDA